MGYKPGRKNLRILPQIQLIKIAKSLRGTVINEGRIGVIAFQRNHLHYRAEIKSAQKAYSIRVTSEWPDPDFRLKVVPNDHQHRFEVRFLGQKDVEVDNPEFDKEFIIETNNLAKARIVLDPTTCKRIRSHREKAHKRISIIVSGGTAELGGMANQIFATKQIMAIATNFAEIHYLMLNASSGMLKIDATLIKMEESVCLVCGETVEQSIGVSCGICETTYHQDCWKYIGKCSTYGCRSRKAN